MIYSQYVKDMGAGVTWNNVSITLNLFFLRIMKEHSIFIEVSLLPKEKNLLRQSREFQKGFEALLMQALKLASGVVSKRAYESQQFVTQYTAQAERLISFYTGIPIDSALTDSENKIVFWSGEPVSAEIHEGIRALNGNARSLTRQLVDFKKLLFTGVVQCRVLSASYPSELQHMIDEAEHYIQNLERIEQMEDAIHHGSLTEELEFWNRIMSGHNKVVAARLDPTEEKLIEKSNLFSKEFSTLADESERTSGSILQVKDKSLEAVRQLQVFQIESLKGFMNCEIRSILNPLRMDHHIRETAHFEFILEAAPKPHV